MSKWIKLSEEEPEMLRELYIYDINNPNNEQNNHIFYYLEGSFYDSISVASTNYYSNSLPTHWCYVPKLPPYPQE